MSIFRVNKTRDYTTMSNHHLKDRELTLKAKGLLSVMLSLPDDWDYTIQGLVSICKENETAVKSALLELKKSGYLEILKYTPKTTQSGRFEYIYNIYETPKQEGKKQGLENLPLEILGLENQGQLNTKQSNTKNKMLNNKKERSASGIKQSLTPLNKRTYDEILANKESDVDIRFVLYEFIKMRKLIKKPLTDYALEQLINKLHKLSNNDKEVAIKILQESIQHSWQGIFPLKNEQNKPKFELTESEKAYSKKLKERQAQDQAELEVPDEVLYESFRQMGYTEEQIQQLKEMK